MTNHPCKVALVTEADGPVGRAAALALARRGWRIAAHCRTNVQEAGMTVNAIEALGQQAALLQSPLMNERDARGLIDSMHQTFAPFSDGCLVNCPSPPVTDSVTEFTVSGLDSSIHATLAMPILMAIALRDASPAASRSIAIQLIDQGIYPNCQDMLSHRLSHAALQAATTILAKALAPSVRTVGVAACLTSLSDAGAPGRQAASDDAALPVTLADVAEAVCFAAESSALTGTTFVVDGGRHLHPDSRA